MRLRRALRITIGLLLTLAGMALVVYGGFLSESFTSDGGQPDYVAGVAMCVGGGLLLIPGGLLLGLLTFEDFLGN